MVLTIVIITIILVTIIVVGVAMRPFNEPTYRLKKVLPKEKVLDEVSRLSLDSAVIQKSGKGLSIYNVRKNITGALRIIENKIESGEKLLSFETLIYNNSLMIEDTINRQIRCVKKYFNLPHVGNYPRIYLLCETILKRTACQCDNNFLLSAIKVFTTHRELTFPELQLIESMTEYCVLEYISIFCSKIIDYNSKMSRGEADGYKEMIDLSSMDYASYLCGIDNVDNDSFIRKINLLCLENGLSFYARIGQLSKRSKYYFCDISNALTLLENMQNIDKDAFVISLSNVSDFLANSPVAVYSILNNDTKLKYLSAISKNASRKNMDEESFSAFVLGESCRDKKDIYDVIFAGKSVTKYNLITALKMLMATAISLLGMIFFPLWAKIILPPLLYVCAYSFFSYLVDSIGYHTIRRRGLPAVDTKGLSSVISRTGILMLGEVGMREEIDKIFDNLMINFYLNNSGDFGYLLGISFTQNGTFLHKYFLQKYNDCAIKGKVKYYIYRPYSKIIKKYRELTLNEQLLQIIANEAGGEMNLDFEVGGNMRKSDLLIRVKTDKILDNASALVGAISHASYKDYDAISLGSSYDTTCEFVTYNICNYYQNALQTLWCGIGEMTNCSIFNVRAVNEKLCLSLPANKLLYNNFAIGAMLKTSATIDNTVAPNNLLDKIRSSALILPSRKDVDGNKTHNDVVFTNRLNINNAMMFLLNEICLLILLFSSIFLAGSSQIFVTSLVFVLGVTALIMAVAEKTERNKTKQLLGYLLCFPYHVIKAVFAFVAGISGKKAKKVKNERAVNYIFFLNAIMCAGFAILAGVAGSYVHLALLIFYAISPSVYLLKHSGRKVSGESYLRMKSECCKIWGEIVASPSQDKTLKIRLIEYLCGSSLKFYSENTPSSIEEDLLVAKKSHDCVERVLAIMCCQIANKNIEYNLKDMLSQDYNLYDSDLFDFFIICQCFDILPNKDIIKEIKLRKDNSLVVDNGEWDGIVSLMKKAEFVTDFVSLEFRCMALLALTNQYNVSSLNKLCNNSPKLLAFKQKIRKEKSKKSIKFAKESVEKLDFEMKRRELTSYNLIGDEKFRTIVDENINGTALFGDSYVFPQQVDRWSRGVSYILKVNGKDCIVNALDFCHMKDMSIYQYDDGDFMFRLYVRVDNKYTAEIRECEFVNKKKEEFEVEFLATSMISKNNFCDTMQLGRDGSVFCYDKTKAHVFYYYCDNDSDNKISSNNTFSSSMRFKVGAKATKTVKMCYIIAKNCDRASFIARMIVDYSEKRYENLSESYIKSNNLASKLTHLTDSDLIRGKKVFNLEYNLPIVFEKNENPMKKISQSNADVEALKERNEATYDENKLKHIKRVKDFGYKFLLVVGYYETVNFSREVYEKVNRQIEKIGLRENVDNIKLINLKEESRKAVQSLEEKAVNCIDCPNKILPISFYGNKTFAMETAEDTHINVNLENNLYCFAVNDLCNSLCGDGIKMRCHYDGSCEVSSSHNDISIGKYNIFFESKGVVYAMNKMKNYSVNFCLACTEYTAELDEMQIKRCDFVDKNNTNIYSTITVKSNSDKKKKVCVAHVVDITNKKDCDLSVEKDKIKIELSGQSYYILSNRKMKEYALTRESIVNNNNEVIRISNLEKVGVTKNTVYSTMCDILPQHNAEMSFSFGNESTLDNVEKSLEYEIDRAKEESIFSFDANDDTFNTLVNFAERNICSAGLTGKIGCDVALTYCQKFFSKAKARDMITELAIEYNVLAHEKRRDSESYLAPLTVFLVADYVKYSLDKSVMNERISYVVDGVKFVRGTMYQHCLRVFEKSLDLSSRGLVLRKEKNGGETDSVEDTLMMIFVLKNFLPLVDDTTLKDRYLKLVECMKKAVSIYGIIDNYISGYDGNELPVGSKEATTKKLSLYPQLWAVASGVCEKKQLIKSIASVNEKLMRGNGECYEYLTNKGGRNPSIVNSLLYTSALYKLGEKKRGYEILANLNILKPNIGSETEIKLDIFDNSEENILAQCLYYEIVVERIFGIRLCKNMLFLSPNLPKTWQVARLVVNTDKGGIEIVIKNSDKVTPWEFVVEKVKYNSNKLLISSSLVGKKIVLQRV